MNKLYELKGYVSKYYTKYSGFIDKAVKFTVALLAFTFINQNIGFLSILSNSFITVLLAVICMLLPTPMTVVFAMLVTLIQLLTLSVSALLVVGMFFLIMYGFYMRYASKNAIIILIVPIAFMLHIPVVVPIVLGLIATPICILPMSIGAMGYYMIHYIKTNSTLLETVGEGGMLQQVGNYAPQIMVNKEMWCSVIAFAICLILVYNVRRMAVDYAWEIAIVAGVLGNINAMAYGYIIMDISLSDVSLIVGSIVAVVIAFVVKFFVFSVDYTRTERLQFEDDEYYYYVKAVPKVSVTVPEKTVKHINERQKTGVIDTEQVKQMEERKEKDESEIQKIIEEELKL